MNTIIKDAELAKLIREQQADDTDFQRPEKNAEGRYFERLSGGESEDGMVFDHYHGLVKDDTASPEFRFNKLFHDTEHTPISLPSENPELEKLQQQESRDRERILEFLKA